MDIVLEYPLLINFLGKQMQKVSQLALKQHWSFWDAYLDYPKYLFLKKKIFLEKNIRNVNIKYCEIGKLVYPGSWRTLFWSQDVTVSMFFQMVLECLFDGINCTSPYSNGIKSLGSFREYFMAVGFGSVLSLCSNG